MLTCFFAFELVQSLNVYKEKELHTCFVKPEHGTAHGFTLALKDRYPNDASCAHHDGLKRHIVQSQRGPWSHRTSIVRLNEAYADDPDVAGGPSARLHKERPLCVQLSL